MASYTTKRKIKIIVEKYGEEWKDQFPDESIDSLYSKLINDTRLTLYCKIESNLKNNLDEMAAYYDLNISDLISYMIKMKYAQFREEKNKTMGELVKIYTE